jgi:hypothetical protein
VDSRLTAHAAAQHEYTVDGVTNLNLGINTWALVSVDPDALEELQLQRGNTAQPRGGRGGGRSYVGSSSRNLARRTNLNALPAGTTFRADAQDPTKYANGAIPASETGLPSIYAAAGASFGGAKALPVDYLRPFPSYSDITYYVFDADSTYHSLQVEFRRRFTTGITSAPLILCRELARRFPTTALTPIFRTPLSTITVWLIDALFRRHLCLGPPPGRAAFRQYPHRERSPTELGLTISGQDAGNRLLAAYSATNLSGQAPRFLLDGDPQTGSTINAAAFVVPGVGVAGPYPRFYLRNPGILNLASKLSTCSTIPSSPAIT